MANHSSTKKSIRKTKVRTLRNRSSKSRIRTFIKKLEDAITQGNKDIAANSLKEMQSELLRGVTKGVIHLKTASRKISRLSAKVKSLAV